MSIVDKLRNKAALSREFSGGDFVSAESAASFRLGAVVYECTAAIVEAIEKLERPKDSDVEVNLTETLCNGCGEKFPSGSLAFTPSFSPGLRYCHKCAKVLQKGYWGVVA